MIKCGMGGWKNNNEREISGLKFDEQQRLLSRDNLHPSVFAALHKAVGCDVRQIEARLDKPRTDLTTDGEFARHVYRYACDAHHVESQIFMPMPGGNFLIKE